MGKVCFSHNKTAKDEDNRQYLKKVQLFLILFWI